MKTFCTTLLLFATVFSLNGQALVAPDTLINERFEADPTPFMAPVPSGEDQIWVNFDGDQLMGQCIEGDETPPAWFWESDLGLNDPLAQNSAFTSCSWLENEDVPAQNWLILKPIFIPGDDYWLCWRSLTFEGPGFTDGYKVLVSTTSNDLTAGVFTDTLFKAAEMVSGPNSPSLNLDDYVFSEGYLHANGFTDTSYFFLVFDDFGNPFYRGRLEPHEVSLKNYSGKTIYIAFLHDSQYDNLMQLDDIVVSNSHVSATVLPQNFLFFNVLPNPARDVVYFSWKMKNPQESRLILSDQSGKIVLQKAFGSADEGRFFVEMQDFASGIYFVTLETVSGRATAKLVKF